MMETPKIELDRADYICLRMNVLHAPHEYVLRWSEAGRFIQMAALHLRNFSPDVGALHPDEPVHVYIKKEEL